MGVLAETPRTTAGHVLALGGAAVGCGALAVALAARVEWLSGHAGTARPDELVELGVLTVGALVLAWLAASAGLAMACVTARGAGRVWRVGEAWVHRFAPAVVRRALVVAVAAGLGAVSVTTASAAELVPTTSPAAAATVAADGVGIDLGWVVTDPAPTTSPAAAAHVPGETAPGAVPATAGGGGSAPSDPAAPVSPSAGAAAPSTTTTPAAARPSTALEAPGSAAAATVTATTRAAAPREGASTTPRATPQVTRVGAADALPVPHGTFGVPAATGPRVPIEDEGATVVVVRGDTLWGIAARHLPPGASAAEVAAAWPAWYAANAAAIGPDPGVILPGQVLAVPAGVTR